MACLCLGTLGCASVGPVERLEITADGIAPESLTSDSRGAVFIGSATRKILRANAGERTAAPWATAPDDGPPSIFGVFADDRARTLWACAGSVPATTSELYAFDLRTGKMKARFPLPSGHGICNDIAVARDGTVFATDSTNMQIVRLRKGARHLDIWAGATRGAFGEPNGIVDGIAIVGNRVFVNTLITRKLFGIEMRAEGDSGAIIEIALSRVLDGPDGMRSFGDSGLLVAESGGDGGLAHVVVRANSGSVTTIQDGFERGAVAVTIHRDAAFVLGQRPIPAVETGGLPRFEVMRVPLP
jgi:outer membrane protein assembly factor BamB